MGEGKVRVDSTWAALQGTQCFIFIPANVFSMLPTCSVPRRLTAGGLHPSGSLWLPGMFRQRLGLGYPPQSPLFQVCQWLDPSHGGRPRLGDAVQCCFLPVPSVPGEGG